MKKLLIVQQMNLYIVLKQEIMNTGVYMIINNL